jgi:hypothetical protein
MKEKPKKIHLTELVKAFVESQSAPNKSWGKPKKKASLACRTNAFTSIFGRIKNREARSINTCEDKVNVTKNGEIKHNEGA